MDCVNKEINMLRNAEAVYIYGAGDVAREVAYCLMDSPFQINIEAFLVSDINDCEGKKVLNKPVIPYIDIKDRKNVVVVIAVLEKYRDEIALNLKNIGIEKQSNITFESDLWCEIRGEYFNSKSNEKKTKDFFWLEDALNTNSVFATMDNRLKVYVAKSHVDKELSEQFIDRYWEESIQVGAALTDNKICEIRDNQGIHISEKNRQYCELTALYWLWKNTDNEMVGLSHYRRRFILTDSQINAMIKSDIDAVFTTPVLNTPNVKYMYEKNHSIKDWEIMKEVVKTLNPEYLESVENIEMSMSYIPYNMFIMKRRFLNAYCEWLFPILEHCEKKIGIKEDTYQNRYLGFLAERLMSVYYLYNLDKYKMVFAHKHFLE